MTEKRILELDELTSVDGANDVLVIVDNTDATTKKVKAQYLGLPTFLTTPLTSTAWDGDAYSTTAKTKIDLSSVFSAPAGIKAVVAQIISRDSGSATDNTIYFGISPNDTPSSLAVMCTSRMLPNDTLVYETGICPCDSNGDIYYQIKASGSATMDCYIRIWGYWV